MWQYIDSHYVSRLDGNSMEWLASMKNSLSPSELETANLFISGWVGLHKSKLDSLGQFVRGDLNFETIYTQRVERQSKKETSADIDTPATQEFDENTSFDLLTVNQALEFANGFCFEPGTLTYILWDATESHKSLPARPFYVGTAKKKSRIEGHTKKDRGDTSAPARANHDTLVDIIDKKYASHGESWMKISLRPHSNFEEAQKDERKILSTWGISSNGGILLNRRISG